MRCRIGITTVAILATLSSCPASLLAESSRPAKVLTQKDNGFNTEAIESLILQGDSNAAKGKLEEAKKHYDKARKASKQLLSFYRDLSGAFRGLDARIPREMDTKGRETLELLAQSNLRLAALFRRKNQPEIAVPLLVEVIKLMTPTKPKGQKAYQRLVELGFVDTPYAGSNPSSFN